MGYYVNPNNDGFQESLNDEIYIDKSMMLAVTNSLIDTRHKCVCVSRARRFGKSMAIDLLAAYYSKGCNSKEQFAELKIASNASFEKHLNKYNVIWLNLSFFKDAGNDIADVLPNLNKYVTDELKDNFPEYLEENDNYLPKALEKIYIKTSEKFIVLIDEWDLILRDEKATEKVKDDYVEFLRGFFKDRPFIRLAYITGILPIKRYNTQSALNNFDEYTMINPMNLADAFGFTESEVKDLCVKYNRDYEQIKSWYDGYLMPNNVHIYNPRSVVMAMKATKLQGFWTETASFESLKMPINLNFDGLKESVIELLGGKKCKVNTTSFQNDISIVKNRDDALTLLIHLGYLGYDEVAEEIFIPNREIKGEFENAISNSDWKEVARALKNSENLLMATLNGDEEIVAEYIAQAHLDVSSIFKYNSEETLSCVVSIAYYAAINYYSFIRELATGKGYADLVLLPNKYVNKPLIIIELKHNKSAVSAIEQIKEKKYTNAFKNYTGEALLVGINYDDDKKHTCKIEKIAIGD